MTRHVKSSMLDSYKTQWVQTVNRDQSARNTGGNKLRNYRLLNLHGKRKKICQMIMPQSHTSAFAKFRSGVPQLRIETGGYEGVRSMGLINALSS